MEWPNGKNNRKGEQGLSARSVRHAFQQARLQDSRTLLVNRTTFNTARSSQTAVPTEKRECVPKEGETTQTVEEKNKALVLEAFETLFNKKDYAAALSFWSPSYIQHSKHIPPGRDGLFGLVKAAPETMRYENGAILSEGNLLMLHGRFTGLGLPANWIVVDIVRLENGLLAEHWDVVEDEATRETSVSGLPMFGAAFPSE